MRTNGLLLSTCAALALALLATGTLGACSIEDLPHAPTFEADVKPIMLSRCVRCHGAGGHLNADAKTTDPGFKRPADGFFDRMEDLCIDGQPPVACHGLGHYTSPPYLAILVNFIHHDKPGTSPMPPLPAPPLTDRQLDIIDLWLANGAPAR